MTTDTPTIKTRVAANRWPKACALGEGHHCTGQAPAYQGVYLKGVVLCGHCVAYVMRRVYQDGPYTDRSFAGVPTRLIRWAASQNGIQKERWVPAHG